VTESAQSRNVPVEDYVPGAPLESILCTEELQRRPSRAPDYEKENQALVKLVRALADSPATIFRTLAETIQDITQCDSAGLSLLTRDGKTPHVDGERFYWPAIAGMWNPHVGGGTPRNFGPCGDVLDQNRTLLFTHFERRYPYLMPVNPAAEECLLVPFYVDGKAVGTIWGIMHSDRRKFDAEDERVMASLGKFASSAYQALTNMENLRIQASEPEKAEADVRELAAVQAVTARRLIEEARDKARSELTCVARVMSMGTLAASIAHEVNQPLSGIVINANTCLRMLSADPPNIEGARETTQRTIRDGNRASEVITRLRALYSKKEATTEPMDLNDAARDVIALSWSQLERDGVILRLDLPDDLPLVIGDRVQLQQVILNLLRNASDAMSTINDRPRLLLIRTEPDGNDRVRLSVSDVGVGFEPQAADKLFEAFYTTKNEGMGIGLSVSRAIIERHRGRLWATPNKGPGAAFSFSIPRSPDSLAHPDDLRKTRAPGGN
jgi:signal transduction histidine kinase